MFWLWQVIATHMTEEEILGLKEMFKSMDTDNSGTITLEELKQGLKKLGTNMPDDQVRELYNAVRKLSLLSVDSLIHNIS